MGMPISPCTLFFLAFSFDSPALEVSNRVIAMVPQTSTEASGKTASIPDRASHARGAGILPGPTTLRVDPFPFLARHGRSYRRLSGPWSWVLVAACCMLQTSGVNLQALEFKAEGSVTYSPIVDGREHANPPVNFRMLVDGPRYSLRITQEPKRSYDYQDVAYDGSNLFYLISLATSIPALLKKAPVGVSNLNTTAAFIYDGPILHNALAHEAGPLWLALASGSYFSSLTNSRIEGVLCVDSSGVVSPDTIRIQDAQWTCQRQFPHLPEKVVFFDSGGIPGRWTNGVPYNNGFTSAVYIVRTFMQVDGVAFPQQAALLTYSPMKAGRRNTDLIVSARYDIHFDEIHLVRDVPVVPPDMPSGATLIDARFYDKAGNVAFMRAAKWPRKEATLSTPEYRKGVWLRRAEVARRRELLRAPESTRSARRLVMALFCITSLSAVFALHGLRRVNSQQSGLPRGK
jgi:hypothetical protein